MDNDEASGEAVEELLDNAKILWAVSLLPYYIG